MIKMKTTIIIGLIATLSMAASDAFASTTAPPIVAMGTDNVARTMAYTAFNNNGQVEKNPDFEITQNNVVSIVANGKLTLLSTNGLGFSNAQVTDANQKITEVPIVNNQVTFTTPGVFTFTVGSGQYAYTCIVVVGEQPKQNIDKQISKTYVIIDIIIEDDPNYCERNPKDPTCIDPEPCIKPASTEERKCPPPPEPCEPECQPPPPVECTPPEVCDDDELPPPPEGGEDEGSDSGEDSDSDGDSGDGDDNSDEGSEGGTDSDEEGSDGEENFGGDSFFD